MSGSRYERRLVNWLDAHGWQVMKSPASGSRTERDQPDLVAGYGGKSGPYLALEHKTRSNKKPNLYLAAEEVEALLRFAREFGAEPRISIWWKNTQPARFYVVDIRKFHETDSGNWAIHMDTSMDEAEFTIERPEPEDESE